MLAYSKCENTIFYFLLAFAFQDKRVIGTHSFSVNMKLEAVDPWSPFGISPATVVKVKWRQLSW